MSGDSVVVGDLDITDVLLDVKLGSTGIYAVAKLTMALEDLISVDGLFAGGLGDGLAFLRTGCGDGHRVLLVFGGLSVHTQPRVGLGLGFDSRHRRGLAGDLCSVGEVVVLAFTVEMLALLSHDLVLEGTGRHLLHLRLVVEAVDGELG